MVKLDRQGRVFYTKNGIPRIKRYLDEAKGQPLSDVWSDINPVVSWAPEKLGYDTQKPEALLERIITSSSEEGSIVLDCFVGSGTTAAVAEKLNRRWVAVDIGRFAIHTTRKRLLDIPQCAPFFVLPNPDLVPASVHSKISGWADYVDYWVVDFTYGATNHGKIFHNQWQSYRTRANRMLERNASHDYDEPGSYTILVKVIDIFGNDTITAAQVSVT